MSQEEILLEPFNYLIQHAGKELRSRLIEAFDIWLKVPTEKLTIVKSAVEMLHTASLLGNYVYFLALEKILKLQCPRAVEIFTEELLNLHRGQGMDLYWRDTVTCPSEEEYMEMVSNKTGGLLRLAVKLMQALSESKVDYVPLVNLIGKFYQIRDDYLNLQSSQYAENKGFAEDLTEGKFSFPIIHCIRTDTRNRQMLNILKQRSADTSVKKYAVDELMQRTKSFQYTVKCLRRFEADARALIAVLGGNLALETIIDYLAKDYANALDK
ncbi:Geranylgeranyl pyrophosphate synthase [Gonapodya sp. JEL0774]|nr:Geranylgeranyl pyrophosphate synthase [Gonapodya sp. JEL0774]